LGFESLARSLGLLTAFVLKKLLPGAFRGAARGVMLLVLADALDEASGRPGASDVSSGAAAWLRAAAASLAVIP
jgi:hypothetical protein